MRFGSVFGNNEVSFWQYLLIFNEILLFNEIYFVVLQSRDSHPVGLYHAGTPYKAAMLLVDLRRLFFSLFP